MEQATGMDEHVDIHRILTIGPAERILARIGFLVSRIKSKVSRLVRGLGEAYLSPDIGSHYARLNGCTNTVLAATNSLLACNRRETDSVKAKRIMDYLHQDSSEKLDMQKLLDWLAFMQLTGNSFPTYDYGQFFIKLGSAATSKEAAIITLYLFEYFTSIYPQIENFREEVYSNRNLRSKLPDISDIKNDTVFSNMFPGFSQVNTRRYLQQIPVKDETEVQTAANDAEYDGQERREA